MLVANPSYAAKSVRELIEMAKERPGAINFASGGVGTTPHMAAELFLFNAGIRMTHVSYRGEAPAIADVWPEVPLVFANVSVVTGQVSRGPCARLPSPRPSGRPACRRSDARRVGRARGRRRDLVRPHRARRDAARDRAERRNAEVQRALADADLQQRFAELSLLGHAELAEELDA